MDYAPRSSTKYFNLGKTKVEVVNHRNKEFWIENLVIGLESNNEVNVMSRGSVQVDSLKELGVIIKKYRNTYKRMLELSKQLRMSEDFE
jgi:Na+-transporting NADH:ubiquinone oxidoreductase subunit NqrF